MIRRLLVPLAVLGTFASQSPAQDEPPPAPQDTPTAAPPAPERTPFAGTAADLAATHDDVTLRSLGRSFGGRPLDALTIGPPDATWEALVVAGLHGRRDRDETRLALDVAAWLAEHVAELPEGCAFVVLPDGNPDATAAAGTFPRAGNDRPVDDDHDGDTDEDGPDDVDGDGQITWMRVKDPTGDWTCADDGHPVRAEPAKGRPGAYRIVPEGRDDDDDGAWNEDGQGGVDIARNFTWRFAEQTALAGAWPASEAETRAVLDLLLADERIALVYEIGGAETIAAAPGWTGPWQKLPDDDAELLAGLREIHAAGAVEKGRKADAPGAGSLGACVWHQLGRMWVGRAPLGRPGDVWPDGVAEWPADRPATWTPVSGAGLPAGADVLHIARLHKADDTTSVFAETASIGGFLRDVALRRARLGFTETVTDGPSGVLRLRTRVVDLGRLPTHTARGAELRARRPLNIRIVLPDGARLAAGRPLVQVERLAAGAATDELTWVVTGPTGAEVRVEVTGPDTGTATLEAQIP